MSWKDKVRSALNTLTLRDDKKADVPPDLADLSPEELEDYFEEVLSEVAKEHYAIRRLAFPRKKDGSPDVDLFLKLKPWEYLEDVARFHRRQFEAQTARLAPPPPRSPKPATPKTAPAATAADPDDDEPEPESKPDSHRRTTMDRLADLSTEPDRPKLPQRISEYLFAPRPQKSR